MIKVVVYGNCQSESIFKFFKKIFGDIQANVEVRHISNFQDNSEDNLSFLNHANLIIEQIIFENNTHTLLKDIDRKKVSFIRFPFISCTFLWPYEQDHPRNIKFPFLPSGPCPGDCGNMFINKLINEGLNYSEVIDRWLNTDLTKIINLDRYYHATKTLAQKIGKDSDFCLWDYVEKNYQSERLFYTARHPTRLLLERLISGVFERLNFEIPPEIVREALFEERYDISPIHNPVHPDIIKHFGLKWCDKNTKYRYFDEDFYTYEEHIHKYVKVEFDEDLLRGASLTREGNPAEFPNAENLLKGGIQRHPNSPYALIELATNLIMQNKCNEALPYAIRATELCPQIPRFYRILYEILNNIGQKQAAEQAANKFLKARSQVPV